MTRKQVLPVEEAREFARSLGLQGHKECREYCKSGKKPSDIPAAPDLTYKNKGWSGIRDWLGTKKPNPNKKIRNLGKI